MNVAIKKNFSSLSDEQWLNLLVSSVSQKVDGLPGFPDTATQTTFVGSAGEEAIRAIFPFYQLARESVQLTPASNVLDFGFGWGRILRMLLRDVDPSNLYGVDIDLDVIQLSHQLGVPGALFHISPLGDLPFGEATFDLITAVSVFSHLSGEAAAHWLLRLMRALRPGGALVLTTTGLHFLNVCVACAEKGEALNDFEKMLGGLFKNPVLAREHYLAGQMAYTPVGGAFEVLADGNYGWASMPKQFVEQVVGDMATQIDFYDSDNLDQQVNIVVRRK